VVKEMIWFEILQCQRGYEKKINPRVAFSKRLGNQLVRRDRNRETKGELRFVICDVVREYSISNEEKLTRRSLFLRKKY
jgi:hypothetical protein